MAGRSKQRASKADVQTTRLNKLPVPGQDDTEFSAEEAAEVFEQTQTANRTKRRYEQQGTSPRCPL